MGCGTVGKATHRGKKASLVLPATSFRHLQKQDDINPRCWMNVEPPNGARQIVLKAVDRKDHHWGGWKLARDR
jgi:hypothetical protein